MKKSIFGDMSILEKAMRLGLLLISVLLLLLAGPWYADTFKIHPDSRLQYDPDMHYTYLSAGDSSSAVFSGDGAVIRSISFRYRVRQPHEGAEIPVLMQIFSTDKGEIFHQEMRLPAGISEETAEIPLQLQAEKDVIYQMNISPAGDQEIGVGGTKSDGSAAIVLHRDGDPAPAAAALLFACLRAGLLCFAVMAAAAAVLVKVRPSAMALYTAALFLTTLCMQYFTDMTYESAAASYTGIFFLLLLTAMTFLEVFFPDKTWLRPILLLALGLSFMFILPPAAPPDEAHHFYRAFEISCRNLFSKSFPGGAGGNILPAGIEAYTDPSAVLDWGNASPVLFSNTALYFPTCYLPQALGIRIARLFTNHTMAIFYAGRAANFATAYVLSILALKYMPFGKTILFIIMCFPVTLQEMVSLSPDAVTNALSFLFLAGVLRLCHDGKQLTRRQFVRLLVCSLWLSAAKVIYVAAGLIAVLLPASLYKDGKTARRARALLLLTPVIANILSMSYSARFIGDLTAGVNAAGQVKFALTNPVLVLLAVIRSTAQDLQFWVRSMTADYMGSLNLMINPGVTLVLMLLLGFAVASADAGEADRNRRLSISLMILAAFGFLAMLGSLYVTWTVVGAGKVNGIQGRYLIPFVPMVLAGVVLNRPAGHRIVSSVYAFRNRTDSTTEAGTRYRLCDLLLLTLIVITAADLYLNRIRGL